MDLDQAREILFKNKKLREIRKKNQLKYQMANLVFEARLSRKMTQAQLAKKVGTEQPSIARIENGDVLPSLDMLEKIAKALKTNLITPKFEFMEEKTFELFSNQAKSEAVISAKILGNIGNYYLICPISWDLEGRESSGYVFKKFVQNGGLNG